MHFVTKSPVQGVVLEVPACPLGDPKTCSVLCSFVKCAPGGGGEKNKKRDEGRIVVRRNTTTRTVGRDKPKKGKRKKKTSE